MWRVDQLLVEARRNLGPAHAVLGVLAVLVAGAVTALVLIQGSAALSQEAERRAAGSLVWSATASDLAGPLDGAACARLAGLPGVAASGGQAVEAPADLHAFRGGMPLAVAGLTPGAVQVFVPSAPWATATVGTDTVELGEVARGSWLVDGSGARVVQVTDVIAQAPVSALSSGITVPVDPASDLVTCWVRMEPGVAEQGGDVLTAAFPAGRAAVAPFLRDQAGALTPLARWEAVLGLHPWAIGGGVIAVTGLLLLWARRTEIAVYRAFGTSRVVAVASTAIELLLVLLPATVAGVLAGAVACAGVTRAGASAALVATAAGQAVAAVCAGLVLTLVLAPLTTRRGLTDTLRDR